MLCSEASLVNHGWDGIQAVSMRCRAWTCPECRESRRKQLIALAISGNPNTFITLTVNPAIGSSPYDRARRLADAWRAVIRLLKRRCVPCRKAHAARCSAAGASAVFQGRTLADGTRCCYGLEKLPYFCVFEATRNGEPHLHILARVKWISQKWLSKQMNRLMLAPVVDVRRVHNKKKLAYYVSKYCGKDPHRFTTCKRYWTTRDYEVVKYVPERPPGRWHKAWTLVRTPLNDLADDWRSAGLEVTRSRHRIVASVRGPPEDVLVALRYITARRRMNRPW